MTNEDSKFRLSLKGNVPLRNIPTKADNFHCLICQPSVSGDVLGKTHQRGRDHDVSKYINHFQLPSAGQIHAHCIHRYVHPQSDG